MSLDFIIEMYIPVVMAACLVIGFVLKKWVPGDNKWIPTILVILGAILGCVANSSITLDYVVAGAVTGLASTGLHQLFKQIIEPKALQEDTSTEDDLEATEEEAVEE